MCGGVRVGLRLMLMLDGCGRELRPAMAFLEEIGERVPGLLPEDFVQRAAVSLEDEGFVKGFVVVRAGPVVVVVAGRHVGFSMGWPGPAGGGGSRPEGWLVSDEPFRAGGARGVAAHPEAG